MTTMLANDLFAECRGCGSEEHALGGTLKCPACVAVDVHNYRALHDGRMKTRTYNSQEG